jgi:hypothetical protein
MHAYTFFTNSEILWAVDCETKTRMTKLMGK